MSIDQKFNIILADPQKLSIDFLPKIAYTGRCLDRRIAGRFAFLAAIQHNIYCGQSAPYQVDSRPVVCLSNCGKPVRGRFVMAISKELQLGKAGEHLVVADLILGGYSAFLSDQGLNYDVVADVDGRLVRIQVKATLGPKTFNQNKRYIGSKEIYIIPRAIYRFGMRRGKGAKRSVEFGQVDVFAFVALDTRKIAYIKASDLISKNGIDLLIAIEFAVNDKTLNRGVTTWGRKMEDYEKFTF